MTTRFLSALMVTLLGATSALAQDGIVLSLGRFQNDDLAATQTVAIENNTASLLALVEIECGFFLGKELIGASAGAVENLAHEQTGFAEVFSFTGKDADRAECRVVSAE